jgi:hypothetical protein
MVFCYPYWIYIDAKSPPTLIEAQVDNVNVRIYPPFRTSPWHSLNVARVDDPFNIPFTPAQRPDYSVFKILPPPLVIPQLADDNGKVSNKVFMPDMQGKYAVAPKDNLPSDSLRLDVYGNDADASQDAAYGISKHLMEIIRWKSGQWWMTRSVDGLAAYGGLPFQVDESGKPLKSEKLVGGATRATTVDGTEQGVNDMLWREAIQSLQRGEQIPVWELFLLDAKYFRGAGDYRRAVLDCDAACEQLKEVTFERLWSQRNPGRVYDEAKRNDLLRNWDLPRHLDIKFNNHFGRSYKQDSPSE